MSQEFIDEQRMYDGHAEFIAERQPAKGHYERLHRQISGKWRELWVADKNTEKRLDGFQEYLYALDIEWPKATCGSVPGRGSFANAEIHIENGSKFFRKYDLKDAYSHVDILTLIETLDEEVPAEDQEYAHDIIYNFATIDQVPGLPQGLSTSPHLFDIYYRKLDQKLERYCSSRGIVYSRYLDDFTFSSQEDVFTPEVNRQIRRIIESHPGAIIHDKKTKNQSHDISLVDKAVTITGVSLYPDEKIGPSPKTKRQINKVCTTIPKVIRGEAEPVVFNEKHERRLRQKFINFDENGQGLSESFHWVNGERKEPAYIDWLLTTMDNLKGYRSLMGSFLNSGYELTNDTYYANQKIAKTIKLMETHLVNKIIEVENEFGHKIPDEWNNFLYKTKKREMQLKQDQDRRRSRQERMGKHMAQKAGVVSFPQVSL